ncbi:hypothetical protein [Micromonospora narathiwatensis]|uniref:PknH-like extracellular domain-containing protein n=1 Tax=Micromonospora narathiwatensis TaxID=299146 RepID=A0A1A8ZLK0_9ACTN|nr:hypothetical protein [Micromonospora narathiwatensis]SBT44693.1 hypothetical protein GA0070621_2136 [Micromonospora narathiwatensis]
MSDDLDALFTAVRGTPPPAAFAPAEQVRRRGRQRRHRQVLAAGGGVLTVATVAGVLGAGLTGSRPEVVSAPAVSATSSSAASASVAPSPSTGAPSMVAGPSAPASATPLLQPQDLGPGDWRRFEAEQLENPDRWYWGFWEGMCPAYRSRPLLSLPRQAALQTVAYRTGGTSGGASVSQIVERYAPGGGPDNLTDVRAVIDRCGQPMPTSATPTVERFAIVDTGFAGDESLLVRQDVVQLRPSSAGTQHVDYIAVVRVGDVVTTVRAYPPEPDRVRGLAGLAAARLG